MKVIKIIIEKDQNGSFWATAENIDGIYAVGDTVEEVKESVLDALETLKMTSNPPKELNSKYKIAYKFDTESLLQYYKKILSAPAFEKITGINQKQIHHYASGLKKPRETQKKKIENALHEFGKELLSVEL
ncbi:type II toxin-antitoxin system HicB family antitoxin [Riemerella columbipharyngis]|uniref:Uncharacterized protein n=1 Tax=Riemerella columbipharyngis TaxID=1071918 RepID=A0A1G7F185_9FLAO|nr:type II toxin-antitoxin system HicB family antitoxin [Riemerella columbipharyngis]SDE69612.1 hypothetical protein SAMN05421544_11854 [Riemerella columbipharyngis]